MSTAGVKAKVRGRDTIHALEGLGKSEGTTVAHPLGYFLDRQVTGCQQVSRMLHAQLGELLHRAASENLAADAPQMFSADVGNLGHLLNGPVPRQRRYHCIEDCHDTCIAPPRVDEA